MSAAKSKPKNTTKPPKSPTPAKSTKATEPPKPPKSPSPAKKETLPSGKADTPKKTVPPTASPQPPKSPAPPKSPVPPVSPDKNGTKPTSSRPVDRPKQPTGGQSSKGTVKEIPTNTQNSGPAKPISGSLPKDGSKGSTADGVDSTRGVAPKATGTTATGKSPIAGLDSKEPNKDRALPPTPGAPGVPPGVAPTPKLGSSPLPAKVMELPVPPHPSESLQKGQDSANRLVSLDALSKPAPNKPHINTPILPPSNLPTTKPLPQQQSEAERFKELNKKGRMMVLRAYMSMKTCADESYPSQFSTALCEESHSSGSRYDVAALGGVDSAGILSYDGALAVTIAVNMASRPKKVQINEEQVDYLCTKMGYAYEKGKFGPKVPQDAEFAMNSEIKLLCPDLYMMDMVHDILLSHIRCTAQNMEVDPKGMIETIDISYYDPSEKPQKAKGLVPVKHQ